MGATPNPLHRRGANLPARSTALLPGCLAVIACCAAVGLVVLYFLPEAPSHDPTGPRIFAAAIGLFGGLGLQSFYWLARGFSRGAGSQTTLLARARRNAPPVAGEPIIATGVLRSERPLTSPLGGVPCVAYDYRMYTERSVGSGKRNEIPVYWGYAAQPFAIDGPSIRYPVASVPFPPDKATELTGNPEALARARAYVRATGWETVEFGMLGTLNTVFERASDASATGTRRDFALTFADAPDVAALRLEESVLPIGETVSAYGRWSSTRGAIVAADDIPGASHVAIAIGGPERLANLPGVPHSTGQYVTTAIIVTLIAGGLYWIALIAIPTMH